MQFTINQDLKQIIIVQHGQSYISGGAKRAVTGSDVTGSHVNLTGKDVTGSVLDRK
jgi:hypothetical protein